MNKTSRLHLMCQHIFTLLYSGGGVQKDALVQSVEFITFFLVLFFVYWKNMDIAGAPSHRLQEEARNVEPLGTD